MAPEPLPRGGTIGILGGGQLGRMLAQAAAKLGFGVCVLAPETDSPAFAVSGAHIVAGYDDAEAFKALAARTDVVTFEFENVSAEALSILEGGARIAPPRRALEVTQDRVLEKRFLASLSLPTAPWAPVENAQALEAALSGLGVDDGGWPMFLKLARQGYDGKGQLRIEAHGDLAKAQDWLGGAVAVLEKAVPYEMELSVIAARAADGAMVFYDLPQNLHRQGVLRESVVPAPVPDSVRPQAEGYVRWIAEALDYVGVIAVELFLVRDGSGFDLLVNEIAPRVHNSGHWTIEACAVSQFENHIRAVAGWPLGVTARHANARMVNLLGDDIETALDLIRESPARSLNLYGKREARPGRKMGHYVELTPLRST
jgi:5-(carboxyamino)imidazole ribonucleotide synthase